MSSHEKLSRKQLIEMAALDAFDLLDPDDAAAYNESFFAQPETVQDEIRDLQAAIVEDVSALLPDDDSDRDLRSRVLIAVARRMELETTELAPLASIGRARSSAVDGDPASVDRAVRSDRAMHFWRAASFMLAACLVLCAMFLVQVNQHTNKITELVLGKVTHEQLRAMIGPDFEDFIHNPNCQTRVMRPVSDTFSGTAVVYVNEKTSQAFILTIGLPENAGPYTLRIQNPNSEIQNLKRFEPRLIASGIRVENVDAPTLLAARWELTDGTNTIILRSA